MADNVKLGISADANQAIREFTRVINKIGGLAGALKNTARATGKIGTETKRANKSIAKLGKTLKGVMAGFGIGLSAAGLISAISQAVNMLDEHAQRLRRHVSAASREMLVFALMQGKGTKAGRVREIAMLGAEHGKSAGETWDAMQGLQAKEGTYEGGKEYLRVALELSRNSGVELDAARNIVSIGTTMGVTAKQSSQLAYAAGETSQVKPEIIAQAAANALPGYVGVPGGALTGVSVLAALSSMWTDPGQLGIRGRQVGDAMQRRTGKVGKYWEESGLGEDATLLERAAYMISKGTTSKGALGAAGFNEKMSSGLVVLLADMQNLRKVFQKVKEKYEDPDLLTGKIKAVYKEIPMVEVAHKIDAARQQTLASKMLSKGAQRRQIEELGLQRLVAKSAETGGLRSMLSDDQGKATKSSRLEYATRLSRQFRKDYTPKLGANLGLEKEEWWRYNALRGYPGMQKRSAVRRHMQAITPEWGDPWQRDAHAERYRYFRQREGLRKQGLMLPGEGLGENAGDFLRNNPHVKVSQSGRLYRDDLVQDEQGFTEEDTGITSKQAERLVEAVEKNTTAIEETKKANERNVEANERSAEANERNAEAAGTGTGAAGSLGGRSLGGDLTNLVKGME